MTLPLALFIAPGRPLQVPNPFPFAAISWAGRGSIGIPDKWPTTDKARAEAMRTIVNGVSRLQPLVPNTRRLVVGIEKRTEWVRTSPKRGTAIDNMLRAVYAALVAIYGPDVEVAFNGPEDAVCGDFTTPMLGRGVKWNHLWEHRMPMPFVSPLYRGSVKEVASMLVRIANTVGLSRGVVLWMQEYTEAEQRAVIDFGLAVDAAAGVLMAEQGGGGHE